MVDHAIDNADVLRELRRLYRLAEDKSNITIIKIFSFEFILLSFSLLEQWVFAEKDAFQVIGKYVDYYNEEYRKYGQTKTPTA